MLKTFPKCCDKNVLQSNILRTLQAKCPTKLQECFIKPSDNIPQTSSECHAKFYLHTMNIFRVTGPKSTKEWV